MGCGQLWVRHSWPARGISLTPDAWPGDARKLGTLDAHVYITTRLAHYIGSTVLEDWSRRDRYPECAGSSQHAPQFDSPYIPLEAKLGSIRDPTFLGGQYWLPDAVERDPLVHHVYTQLRTELEQWPGSAGSMPMMAFVCKAVDAAQDEMHQYAPGCGSPGREGCDSITVRVALNGLAATARRTIPGSFWPAVPDIPFEHEESRAGVEDTWERTFPRLRGPVAPFELSEWDPGQDSYSAEYDAGNPLGGDKAVHFLTHAFMAYEQRWRGADAYSTWMWNDWQGRALERIMDATHPFSHKEGSAADDADDVAANRWGTAFGLGAFDDPALLVRLCRSSAHSGA